MKSSSEISEICRKYGIVNYTINEDGSIDVDGGVNLFGMNLIEIPLNFNKVDGTFNCGTNNLTSLKGCPKIVTKGGFFCNNNKLTSLEFSPKKVTGGFFCNDNKLRDLYGISDDISGNTYLGGSPISSIFDMVGIDFIRAFNVYRVIKDDKVQLKRLKYVMELFDMEYDLEKIKEYYEII